MADFQIGNYQTDAGTFRPIRVQSFTISTANPNGATNGTGQFVRAGGSRRRYGTVARQVIISRQIGTNVPYGAASVSVSIPFLTKAAYDAVAIGATFTYNELSDWVVTGKQDETDR